MVLTVRNSLWNSLRNCAQRLRNPRATPAANILLYTTYIEGCAPLGGACLLNSKASKSTPRDGATGLVPVAGIKARSGSRYPFYCNAAICG